MCCERTEIEQISSSACSECGGKIERRVVSHEYEREGVRVRVSGIEALVCKSCEAEYALPGETQKLVEVVNNLFEMAQQNGQHKGKIAADIETGSTAIAA